MPLQTAYSRILQLVLKLVKCNHQFSISSKNSCLVVNSKIFHFSNCLLIFRTVTDNTMELIADYIPANTFFLYDGFCYCNSCAFQANSASIPKCRFCGKFNRLKHNISDYKFWLNNLNGNKKSVNELEDFIDEYILYKYSDEPVCKDLQNIMFQTYQHYLRRLSELTN